MNKSQKGESQDYERHQSDDEYIHRTGLRMQCVGCDMLWYDATPDPVGFEKSYCMRCGVNDWLVIEFQIAN